MNQTVSLMHRPMLLLAVHVTINVSTTFTLFAICILETDSAKAIRHIATNNVQLWADSAKDRDAAALGQIG